MHGRHAVGFLLFLAISVPPGYGRQLVNSNDLFGISGYVRDIGDQHGVRNIRVELKRSAGMSVDATFTRADGAFEFSGIPKGQYILEVKAKDYAPLQQAVEIKNSARRRVSLFLISPGKEMDSKLNASVSAHQLSAPNKAQGEFDDGVKLLYDKSDYRAALLHFQRAIKNFPTYYEAYLEEAIAYRKLDDATSAEEALRTSVTLSSGKYSEALLMLSGLLSDQKQYQEAETFARKALEVDGGSWRGPFELARALFGLKQTGEAEQRAVQARDLNPDNPEIYSLLANIHINRHDIAALAKDLDTLLKLEPTGAEADQARKIQGELQAYVKRIDEQTRVDAQRKLNTSADDPADANDASDADDTDSDPAEPDSLILPALPPATPSIP